MQQLTTENITDVVIDQMATTSDPRMREVMAALTRHLHDFAREVNLTPAEWIKGIEFLTKVGHKCTPLRQEFILLSDTLGMSALVNLMHDKTAVEEATQTSLLGPFFRENAPKMKPGEQITKNVQGDEIVMYGQVTDKQGKPVSGATVQVWQTSEEGRYDVEYGEEMNMRGVFETDADGKYLIKTTKPLGYYIPMDGPVGDMIRAQGRHGMRPAHIHFLVTADNYRELITALYLSDDAHINDDVVFGVAEDLVIEIKKNDPNAPLKGHPTIHYDFQLARESEVDRLTGRVGADPAAIMGAAE